MLAILKDKHTKLEVKHLDLKYGFRIIGKKERSGRMEKYCTTKNLTNWSQNEKSH